MSMHLFNHKRIGIKVYQQWQYFLLALQFFTRIPVPVKVAYSPLRLNKSNRYFSLVGVALGLILAFAYQLLAQYLPASVAIACVMTISLLLTGAFHQDGLADMADGIGGGYTVEKRLDIMKDSRIGTYGTVALIASALIMFSALTELAQLGIAFIALVAAHALSRAVAGSLIFTMPYVSEDAKSKSKPLAQQQSGHELVILLAIGSAPILFLPEGFNFSFILKLTAVLLAFRWWYRRWLMNRLGGFTGDCLGAAQQIAELLIYLVIVQHAFAQLPQGLVTGAAQ